MSTRLCREWVASSKVSRYARATATTSSARARGRMDCFGADGPLTASRIVPDWAQSILAIAGVVSGVRR